MIGDLESCNVMADGLCTAHNQDGKLCRKQAVDEWDRLREKVANLELQIDEIPKKILAAVNAEQLRCGKIAEAFWNTDDKLNADLRAKLTQAEKSMAYMISTNIRAMRYREENFTEKRKPEIDHAHLWVGVSPEESECERCGVRRQVGQ